MKKIWNKIKQAVIGRKGIGTSMTVAIIIAVVMFNILAYTVTSAFSLYAYSDEETPYEISGNTDELFASAVEMNKKVKITFCYSESTLKYHDTGSFVLETAREFEERYKESGFIEIRFVNLLTKMDDETKKIVDFKPYCNVVCSDDQCAETMRYVDLDLSAPKCKTCKKAIDVDEDIVYDFNQSSVIFETGSGRDFSYRVLTDKYTSAGFVDFYILDSSSSIVSYNGEEVMAAMISWVLHEDHPTAYLTQNHGETADVALSNLLTCAGFYVDVINLRKEEIPADAGVVIISNPTSDFERAVDGSVSRGEIEKLDHYLSKGGKLYVAFDPYVKELPNLEELLSNWGLELSGGKNDSGVFVRDIIKESSEAITSDGYTFIATYADDAKANEVYSLLEQFGTDKVLMSNVGKINLIEDNARDAEVHPILVSGNTSSAYAGGEATDSDGNYAIAACSVKKVEDKESVVFLLPTAYITATDAFISDNYSNKDFLYATLDVLFDSNSAPYGCNQLLFETQVLENLTMGKARLYTAIILLIPTALAIAGAVIIIKRKNR